MVATAKEILDRFYYLEKVYIASENPTDEARQAWLDTMSPNVILPQSEDLIYGGLYKGRSGVEKWCKAAGEIFEVIENVPSLILEKDDTILIRAQVQFRVRRTKEEMNRPIVQVVTVDREKEWITSMQTFYWNVAEFNTIVKRGLVHE